MITNEVNGFSFHPEEVRRMVLGERILVCPRCLEIKEEIHLLCSGCVQERGVKEAFKKLLNIRRMGWSEKDYQKKIRAFVRAFEIQENQNGHPPFSLKLWEEGFQFLQEGYRINLPLDILKEMSIEAFHYYNQERLYELAREYFFFRQALLKPQQLAAEFLDHYKWEVSPGLVVKTFYKVQKNCGNQVRENVYVECLQKAREYCRQDPEFVVLFPDLAVQDFFKNYWEGVVSHIRLLKGSFQYARKEQKSKQVQEMLEGQQAEA